MPGGRRVRVTLGGALVELRVFNEPPNKFVYFTSIDRFVSLPKSFERSGPFGRGVREFTQNFGVGFAGAFQDVEGVVGGLDDVERRARAEFGGDWLEEGEIGEVVAGALEEKHRLGDFGEVIAAFGGGLFWRMEREAEKDEATGFGD